MFWFQVKFGTRDSAQKTPTPVMVLSIQVHAELWHRRLGHTNSRGMELFRKKDESGDDVTGNHSDCDSGHINKRQ